MVLESLPICQEQTLQKVMLIVSVVLIDKMQINKRIRAKNLTGPFRNQLALSATRIGLQGHVPSKSNTRHTEPIRLARRGPAYDQSNHHTLHQISLKLSAQLVQTLRIDFPKNTPKNWCLHLRKIEADLDWKPEKSMPSSSASLSGPACLEPKQTEEAASANQR